MLKILIVEDEPLVATDIELTIEEIGYQCVGIAEDVAQAMAMIISQEPDLLFLDVKLKGNKDGVDLAMVAKEMNLPFIFITDLKDKETLQRIVSTEPWAYLSKPVTAFNIESNIQLAMSKAKTQKKKEITPSKDLILLRKGTDSERVKVEINDILWIEAAKNFCKAFVKSEETIIHYEPNIPMGAFLEEINNENFVRVHKSYAVNLRHLDSVDGNLLVISGTGIPIGKNFKTDLFQKIRRY